MGLGCSPSHTQSGHRHLRTFAPHQPQSPPPPCLEIEPIISRYRGLMDSAVRLSLTPLLPYRAPATHPAHLHFSLLFRFHRFHRGHRRPLRLRFVLRLHGGPHGLGADLRVPDVAAAGGQRAVRPGPGPKAASPAPNPRSPRTAVTPPGAP